MSLQRFLDWFEGFAENVGEAPTADQWLRIKSKIEALSADDPGVKGVHVPSGAVMPNGDVFTQEHYMKAQAALQSMDQQAADHQAATEREDQRKLRSLRAAVVGELMTSRPDVPPDIMETVAETHVTTDDIGKEPCDIAAGLDELLV